MPLVLLFRGCEGSRSVAGNDGEMAEALRVLSADVTKEKTSSITKERRPGRARRGKAARKSGAERLRQLADKRVGRHSKELADLLTGKALKGDLANIRALVGLAEGKKPRAAPVKKSCWLDQVERLAPLGLGMGAAGSLAVNSDDVGVPIA